MTIKTCYNDAGMSATLHDCTRHAH